MIITECKIINGSKKFTFAMANMQNLKRVKIRMDGVISEVKWEVKKL